MDSSKDKQVRRRRFELKNPALERKKKREEQKRLESQNQDKIEEDSKNYTLTLSQKKIATDDLPRFEDMFPDDTNNDSDDEKQVKKDNEVKPAPKDTRPKPEKSKKPPKRIEKKPKSKKPRREESKSISRERKRGMENNPKKREYTKKERPKNPKPPKVKKIKEKNSEEKKGEKTKAFVFDTDTNPPEASIPKAAMERVIRDIASKESDTNIQFTEDAINLIHTEGEDFLYQLFKRGNVIVEKSKRKTVMSRDFSGILEQLDFNLDI